MKRETDDYDDLSVDGREILLPLSTSGFQNVLMFATNNLTDRFEIQPIM